MKTETKTAEFHVKGNASLNFSHNQKDGAQSDMSELTLAMIEKVRQVCCEVAEQVAANNAPATSVTLAMTVTVKKNGNGTSVVSAAADKTIN